MEWLIILIMLIIIWLLMIWPSDYIKDDKNKLRKYLYAHRGLHDDENDIPENSIAAFDAACQAGYGMELDIQFSKDLQIIVFHDDDLKRMCGVDKKVNELTYEELSQLSLNGTKEKIPLFTDVLKLVNGRTPIVVELKNCKIYERLVEEANKILISYKGDYCVESFNPLIVRKYAKTNPMILRGLLMTNHVKSKSINIVLGFMIQEMLLNFVARPQFIACDHNALSIWGVNVVRFIFKPVMATWTIRSEKEFEKVKNFDIVIFENFLPDPSRPELVN
ncbi:MAG TPA: glycerophosphodiester phosphodiesterase family protein [Clostridia bacterium]|nr:MAG: cytoplasmic glycerophosphodiester phosphodiesterase [Firmicutes bacterium ADurb.Bin146]HOD93190.1 glycerophosphodiester phosphodiesterase family protein [Clostridia bacterium]HQM38919.1 glycerophosphodiester phosphodiesterase family protein [Clostridia bacterium]